MKIIDNFSTFYSFNGLRRKASVAVPCPCFHQTVFYSSSPTTPGLYSASFNLSVQINQSSDTNILFIYGISFLHHFMCVSRLDSY